jgi:hypothetical protein
MPGCIHSCSTYDNDNSQSHSATLLSSLLSSAQACRRDEGRQTGQWFTTFHEGVLQSLSVEITRTIMDQTYV